MFYGTCYFKTYNGAVKYYATQEKDKEQVDHLIKSNIIFIGKPPERDDMEIIFKREEDRYFYKSFPVKGDKI